jgi:hypothetical protein
VNTYGGGGAAPLKDLKIKFVLSVRWHNKLQKHVKKPYFFKISFMIKFVKEALKVKFLFHCFLDKFDQNRNLKKIWFLHVFVTYDAF